VASGDIPEHWPKLAPLATAPSRGLRLAEYALLGNGRALCGVADRLLRILSCKRFLSRSLSLAAFVLLPVSTSDVSLPQV
jgi:hypothetical protein